MVEKIIAQRYILKRKLGAGGMGTVYLGQDTQNQQQLAIRDWRYVCLRKILGLF
jgi:hypothetical protein